MNDLKTVGAKIGNSPVGGATGTQSPARGNDPTAGADFRRALDQFTGTTGVGGTSGVGARTPATDALNALVGNRATLPTAAQSAPLKAAAQLKFSSHAIDRMKSRGISFSPTDLESIQNAVGKAAQKGSRDTLVLTGENALIVSVKNNTVVTVMDRAAMKNNVFTNIDSTVVI